ncbi:MAG: AsmA-like C-terminal region-containing protein [Burkholderiales bacterium]|nr:AsmA-like C-terminal region-containing protein [Burkholderiales bacterium]
MIKYKKYFTKRNIRIVCWTLFSIFFVTFCVPVFFFYYLFDKNKVNTLITKQINSKDYIVSIDGGIEPRSWHGLSLHIANISIYDKNKEKVMHINAVNCQLSWLDLIIGHYKIRRIAFNGLTMYSGSIDKKSYNNFINYDGLKDSELNKLKNIYISNFTMINSEGDSVIRDVSINATNMDTDTPHLKVHFSIPKTGSSFELQGDFHKNENNDVLQFVKLDVNLLSNKYNINLQSGGHYDVRNQEIWFEDAKGSLSLYDYTGSIEIDNALLSLYGVTAGKLQANLYTDKKVSNLGITAINLKSQDFNDIAIKKLAINHDLQNSLLGTNTNLQIKNVLIESGLFLKNDNCLLAYTILAKQMGNTSSGDIDGSCSIDGSVGHAYFDMSGMVDQSYAKVKAHIDYLESIPYLDIVASFNKLDFDKYINKINESSLSSYTDSNHLPLSWLGNFKGKINLEAKEIKLSHTNLSNVQASTVIGESSLYIDNIAADLYSGSIKGSLGISKNESGSYNLLFNQSIKNVNLQKVFTNLFNVSAISGTANAGINTSATNVVTYKDVYQKINGDIKLSVVNGGFGGIDFNLFLNPANIDLLNANKKQTKFTTLKADFSFINGVSDKGNVLFSSPSMNASGDGQIDFANTKIGYNIVIKSIVPHNIHNVNSVSIPISVNGLLFSPKIYIKNMTLNKTSNINSVVKNKKN